MNIFNLFLRSSFLSKTIMLVLIFFSIISWAIIIQRSRILTSAEHEVESFEDKFWSGIELSRLYQESLTRCNRLKGFERIFYTGFKEFTHLNCSENYMKPEVLVNCISRVMRISLNRELESLETHIPLLGMVSSISPYIGLFGTVLGVIRAFFDISGIQQSSLEMVAPGIAEALIATAIGLFVAIPSVIGFHRLSWRINRLEQHYNNFKEEFITILHYRVFSSQTTQQI